MFLKNQSQRRIQGASQPPTLVLSLSHLAHRRPSRHLSKVPFLTKSYIRLVTRLKFCHLFFSALYVSCRFEKLPTVKVPKSPPRKEAYLTKHDCWECSFRATQFFEIACISLAANTCTHPTDRGGARIVSEGSEAPKDLKVCWRRDTTEAIHNTNKFWQKWLPDSKLSHSSDLFR